MRKGINIVLTLAVLIALVAFCFFIQCKLDTVMIIAGFVVVAIAIVISVVQEKKIKEASK